MFLVITLGVLSFLLALLLTPIIRDRIGRYGFLDRPDGLRKQHSVPVPRVGGIAIALSYSATFALALILPFSYTNVLHNALPSIWRLALPALVVLLTGILDDLISLNAWKKLTGILAACAIALWAGLRVEIHIAGWSVHPWVSAAVTVIWLVGCTNAFNLIDGMDGLAAGVGLLATAAMMIAGLTQGNLPLVLATLPLAGCLLGFLFFNFNPASVFLGDSGSLFMGFLLGCYGAFWSEKSITLVAMITPLLAVSVPLLDVVLSIGRRFLTNKPIFTGDRGHIHHRLLKRGFSPKAVVFTIYGFCALAAALSLLVGALHNQFSGLIVILFCAFAWIGIKHLQYTEFKTAGEIFFKGGFRRTIAAEARLAEFEESIKQAPNLDECWTRIAAGTREFGFKRVRMTIDGRMFEHCEKLDNEPLWELRVPLSPGEQITFFGDFKANLEPLVLGRLVNCIERALCNKIRMSMPELIRRPVAAQHSLHPQSYTDRPHFARAASAKDLGA